MVRGDDFCEFNWLQVVTILNARSPGGKFPELLVRGGNFPELLVPDGHFLVLPGSHSSLLLVVWR